MVISIIGDNENLKKFFDVWKTIVEIKKVSFQQPNFEWQSILSCLTEKQKEIIITAKKHG